MELPKDRRVVGIAAGGAVIVAIGVGVIFYLHSDKSARAEAAIAEDAPAGIEDNGDAIPIDEALLGTLPPAAPAIQPTAAAESAPSQTVVGTGAEELRPAESATKSPGR